MQQLYIGTLWYAVFLISTIAHEASHSLAAHKLGDSTAHKLGLMTLDPVVHIKRSPFGMVLVPLVSFIFSGWMIGWASVPVDSYWAHQNKKRSALVSLAGPLANITLVIIAMAIMRIALSMNIFQTPQFISFDQVVAAPAGLANGFSLLISIVFSLNLILAMFNLLPLPPLDGHCLPYLFLNRISAIKYETFFANPNFAVIGLIIAWNFFSYIFAQIHLFVINILYTGITHYS
jgi:Zn-dependent protease